jgi:ribosomal protein L11 methyltransferase
MEYIEVTLQIVPFTPWSDVVASQLCDIGFESCMEEKGLLLAYIQADALEEKALESCLADLMGDYSVSYSIQKVPNENWNKKWEESFEPVLVDDKCLIRASFHEPNSAIPHEIVIDPKMAFGTGHHDTTYLMVKAMFDYNFENQIVLDMGSGTGILAILAKRLGAGFTKAVDNNDWAYESTKENCVKNNQPEIEVVLGDIGSVKNDKYTLILANINRNIVMEQMPDYAAMLPHGGILLTSGYFNYDAEVVFDSAKSNGFVLKQRIERNNWCMQAFEKTS